MKKIELICYIIIGIVIAIGTTVSYANPTFFAEKLTVEDGPFEWITVFMLFITGCLMLRRAILLRNARTKIFILITAGAGLLMWFGAGEELSWGQRIFGIEASDWLKENNTQEDITLHNLKFGDVKINKLVFSKLLAVGLLGYLIILPILTERKPKIKALTVRFAVPLATKIQIIMWIVAMGLPEILIQHKRKGEVRETCAGFIVFVTMLNPRNRYIYNADSPLPLLSERSTEAPEQSDQKINS